jgi:predicted TIM-barrel fold metal-dependent hydrolase
VLKKGDLEAGKWPADPYFFPLYAEAERLDMPICMHLGSGTPNHTAARDFSLGGFMATTLPVIHGVHSLIAHEVPKKFPRLRFGAIEAGASWVPFLAYDLHRSMNTRFRSAGRPGFVIGDNLFKENNIYVTCQIDEDFAMILPYIGEDNLLVGSDYTHQDASQELTFATSLEERAANGDLSTNLVRKLVYDNPKTFYGL